VIGFKDLNDFISRPNELRREAASNLFDHLFGRGLAETRATPSEVIDKGRKRTLHRYEPVEGVEPRPLPLLLVPPLAAPARAFDLRRGCSMAEHMVGLGYPTYLVDYGSIDKSDKDLGVEHWHDEVVPMSIRKVSEDAGGKPVQVTGWCLGGLMSLCALAINPDLPVNAIAMVATPWDTSVMPILKPMREGNRLISGDSSRQGFRRRIPCRWWRAGKRCRLRLQNDELPDLRQEATDDVPETRRPRLSRPRRGRRRADGEHAGLSGRVD